LREDARHFTRALRLRDIADRPALGRLLLDGSVNALRDIFGRPRANLPEAGALRLHYAVAGGAVPGGPPPRVMQRWFKRIAPVFAAAARRVYANDDVPLLDKLPETNHLLLRQINIFDLFAGGALAMAAGVSAALAVGTRRLLEVFMGKRAAIGRGLNEEYSSRAEQAGDLTPLAATAAQRWEARLARLSYQTVKASHIHILWPENLPKKNDIVSAGLWHVCPAHVYEARLNSLGQLQVVVNFENCIKCETCWRTSDVVDWGRDGQQRFIYPVYSPAVTKLLEAVQDAALARPALPRALDWWGPLAKLSPSALAASGATVKADTSPAIEQIDSLLGIAERKLIEFDEALAEEPRTVDRGRGEYLEMLARYAQQVCERIAELVAEAAAAVVAPEARSLFSRMQELSSSLVLKVQERARRTWTKHYAWAASEGRQLRWHHIVGLRNCISGLVNVRSPSNPVLDSREKWLTAEAAASPSIDMLQELDRALPFSAWRDLERCESLSTDQDAVLRALQKRIPSIDVRCLDATLHPPIRKTILAELGRRDPSLAFRMASHLWARDIVDLANLPDRNQTILKRLRRPGGWGALALFDSDNRGSASEAWFVPARGAAWLALLSADGLAIAPTDDPAVQVEPLATLGLHGAGLARVSITTGLTPAKGWASIDIPALRSAWAILSSADLTSIAFGMADQLCRRAIGHATSRVQFPGLFYDQESRDTIGKFGAVKKMIAEMAARRYVIETLDRHLGPRGLATTDLRQAALVKAVVAELLGTSPGSITYNAGQVFGGTGYSEDDILSKFYRDSAAWRCLGQDNRTIYRRRGHELLATWNADASHLATLPGEAALFDELAQRKALQSELDEVRNIRSKVRSLVAEWQACSESASLPALGHPNATIPIESATISRPESFQDFQVDHTFGSPAAAEMAEALARQDALMLAGKAAILRTHARLEAGVSSEVEIALLRVWLGGASTVYLDEFEALVRRLVTPDHKRDDRPVAEIGNKPPVVAYADYLKAPAPYESGDFLWKPLDVDTPRFIPDMVRADPTLAHQDEHYRALLLEQFGALRDGLIYERYVERQHRPDDSDLEFCRRHGFFRLPIAKELGGEGQSKANYYLLTTNAQRLVDVSISLAIQASTSIGTTPVLLARYKDLPKAQTELANFLKDTASHQDVLQKLDALIPAKGLPADVAIQELHQRLDKNALSKSALKTALARFAEAWQRFRRGQGRMDAEALRAQLAKASEAWKDAPRQVEAFLEETGLRLEACDLFLRWVASGQISAFALTEPSAGSDTARVATRAVLNSVPLEAVADGAYRFVPAGGKEARILLDASRVVFSDGSPFYRYSDGASAAPIRFDQYDYETDALKGQRYFEVDGRCVFFTDIASVRKRDGRLWYDYWELTGAKMWITNGRICGIMALYAKTDAGVTGFIVDRHAEGLIVGKDEEKMGQCGSPTNELSLQAVRVPRECVLGLEGRGQVNALETLNVGRAGLAMSAVAQMEGLIKSSHCIVDKGTETVPEWAAWRLARMEENRFTAEAVAYEVIGRFEHPQSQAVRMESAISKMLASELLHQVIEFAEDIHGLAGQTQKHLVEKRKRDARILNIYEGTNEIQRFLILKDLATELASHWSASFRAVPKHLGREALEFETMRETFRHRIHAALEAFGQGLWQDPSLQANCFLLAEAAAWLKAAESSLARLAWLARYEIMGTQFTDVAASQGGGAIPPDQLPSIELGKRALARCFSEVQRRLQAFDEELTHLRRGYYAPEVRAAGLLFDRAGMHAPPTRIQNRISRALRVLVVLDPPISAVPDPRIEDGRLMEPYLTLTQADQSALECALRLRDDAPGAVAIQVLAVGSRAYARTLREVLSRGVDRVRLIVPDQERVGPDNAARAIAHDLNGSEFDLVLGAAGSPGEEQGLIAKISAAALGVAPLGAANEFFIDMAENKNTSSIYLRDADARIVRKGMLPAFVAVSAGLGLRPFMVCDYLGGLARNIEIVRWPKNLPARSIALIAHASAEPAAVSAEQPRPLSARDAAAHLIQELGVNSTAIASGSFEGAIESVALPTLLASQGGSMPPVLAVVGIEESGRLRAGAVPVLMAGRILSALQRAPLKIVALAPPEQSDQRHAIRRILDLATGDVLLISTSTDTESPELRSRLLSECWSEMKFQPSAVVGEAWAEEAFIKLSQTESADTIALLRLKSLHTENGRLIIETSDAAGRLRMKQVVPTDPKSAIWMTLADHAEVPPPGGMVLQGQGRPVRVQHWAPRLDHFYTRPDIEELLAELKCKSGLVRLGDADFIVDVGFGVGNRDGYEAVVEPLVQALAKIGARNVVVGGSRKVTEELHLLPADRQIGQSGVSVNPKILLAIGVSGAPQHLNYIGSRATIVAFNRDPEAPLMVLNRTQPRPRVYPVIGDLFQTVPALVAALLREQSGQKEDLSQLPTPAARAS
jgi:alkylation response protein AidB-like acyl-CoA dehydrogenase/ferredoxin-like protein FixX